MNKKNILLILIIIIIVFLYVYNKQENLTSISNESIQNIASVYNTQNMSVTNLNATGATKLNNLNVNEQSQLNSLDVNGKTQLNNLNVSDNTQLNNLYISGLINVNGMKISANTKKSSIYSPSGVYSLAIQDDGNLVVYKNDTTTVWDSQSIANNLNSTACGSIGLAQWLSEGANIDAWAFAKC